MQGLAEVCQDAVSVQYRSIDRIVLNAYIPTMQTPAAMAVFLREVRRRPILAGKVFKNLTDGFVKRVRKFARQQQIPIRRITGRARWLRKP